MKKLISIVAVLAVLGIAAYLIWATRGFSAREQPTVFERGVARTVRQWAVPSNAREMKNPVAINTEVMLEARAHWADHCAGCHANNGSGETEMGRNLYPKAPDMRAPDTQQLSDGELFFIIENGIRLTGMPAWSDGTPKSAEASWKLVHFIRHLPQV